jgi:nucleotide-binding universal stress UspA family protein
MNLLFLKVVLAAIEMDEAAVSTLRTAAALASAAGARLHIVHVSGGSKERIEPTARTVLDRAEVDADTTPLHVASGDPASAICLLADSIHADVIVLGPHRGEDDRKNRLGSTALAVVTSASAPCLIVGETMPLPIKNVLVPLDLSDTARGALLVALSWASALRGQGSNGRPAVRLTALHADQSRGEREGRPVRQLEEDLARARSHAGTWAGVDVAAPEVIPGEAVAVIVDYAADHRFDLIVLGTRGLGNDTVGRIGSVAGEVARRVDAPVLLVPPATWQRHSNAW